MLSLLVNNQSLDLSADVSITLKFSSPIFNTIGDYTYPFKIPATSKNIAALGFVHRVENFGNVNKSYDAILLSDGITILKGSLRILKAQADFYEASFYMDKGDFSFKRQKATLQDFDFGTMTFASEGAKLVYMNNCKNTVYPARNFSFPMIQNLSYLETYPEPPDRALANINDYWYGIMSNVSIDGNRNIHTPMLYLKYVIKTIFDSMDYTYENTFFDSDSVFNSLVLYNSVDCNGLATGYFNYSNLKLLLSYHVPVISLNDFLSGLENFFNIRFFVNNITGTIKVLSVDDIVKSTSSTEYSKNVSAIYVDNSEKPSGFHLSMNMDTDDTYWANIKSAQETNLEHIKDSVDSYSDLKPWPQSKSLDCKWVRDEQKFYVLWNYVWTVFPWSTQDLQFYSDYFYKGKDLAISTKFST
ncbi:MAG: hypothetical protein NTW16_05125, partial [Bacteroidetes bacterium]|nr:hypothetical protein [Bacteroidota bacterium]